MKNNKKTIIILLIIILEIFFDSNLSYSYTAQPTTEGGRIVCQTAENMLSYMHDHPQWHYNTHIPTTARKNWNNAKNIKRSTCGTFVSWVFQESGYLKPNTTISHKTTSAATKSAYESHTQHCTWYTPNKYLSRIRDQLLPGDCIIFKNTIAIYAGYENGKLYTYNCIDNDYFQDCINAKGAHYSASFIKNRNVICIVRPGEGGNSSNLNLDSANMSDLQGGNGTARDNENDTFIGALGNITRHILDSIITLFENYLWDRNDSTVMYDLNPEDDPISTSNTSDGTMVQEPSTNSVKRFAKTKRAIQNFAITEVNSSDPVIWLGRNPRSDPDTFTIDIYKNANQNSAGQRSARIRLRYGGHQCFDVWQNGNSYNIYTGSQGKTRVWSSRYHRWYYNPKGVAKSKIESITGSGYANMSTKGIRVASSGTHVSALGVDENTNKMVTVVAGRATVWDLDVNNFRGSRKTSRVFRVATNKLNQGGCLNGNYLYLIGGMRASQMKIGCYDITNGQQIWYKELNTQSITGNYELEGIKVYNYNGSNKIFIAFNTGGGIWYFDN